MSAWTAGCCLSEVFDPQDGDPIPMVVLYPATAPEQSRTFGPYSMDVAMDAKIAEGIFRLVVISHGSGGSHLVYRTLARHLARSGFVVICAEHPRNNRNNNELGGTAAILRNRPRHVSLVIDWAFGQEAFGRSLRPNQVAIIGHSLGGYTALAVAGGQPTAFPHESEDGQSISINVSRDHRVAALVLLAPATPWYMAPGSLHGVRVPIYLLTAEKDSLTPQLHAEIIKQGLLDDGQLEHTIIPNAGHYSFLSPFPKHMTGPQFPPCQDPEGFDREQFHSTMNADIVDFLNRVMPNA